MPLDQTPLTAMPRRWFDRPPSRALGNQGQLPDAGITHDIRARDLGPLCAG
jgi:hypothetical protein